MRQRRSGSPTWKVGRRSEVKVGRRREMARGLEVHPIPLAGCPSLRAGGDSLAGINPRGAERDECPGTAVTSSCLVERASFSAWEQRGWRPSGPCVVHSVTEASPLEGTGQVGRPCLDLVSSPVCSSPSLARQGGAHGSQAGGRVARLAASAGTGHRGGPYGKEDEARDPAKKAREERLLRFCCCCCCCSRSFHRLG